MTTRLIMDYMDLTVCYPRKVVKPNYWRMAICENHDLVPAMKEKIIPQTKESC